MENIKIKKEYKIRNKSGLSAYEKEYYIDYAKSKNKELKHCETCNRDISYYSYNRHLTTKSHNKKLNSET